MIELITIGLFCAGLIACLVTGASILYALAFGLAVFIAYGMRNGFALRQLLIMAFESIKTIKNLLITFLLIGILTALWRAAGTIPQIVIASSGFIRPSVFLFVAFLLNCVLSFLTGTSFGTSATMGVICMTIARSMGMDSLLAGGAVISGVFFGDRCSPVSTSALLVAELTGTGIYDNIKNMVCSALVPFLASCAVYLISGFAASPEGEMIDLSAVFGREFVLHWAAFIPAIVILLLALLRVNVKAAMLASIAAAAALCVLLQHRGAVEILRISVLGYKAADQSLASMIDGGGLVSMVRVSCIVCLSTSYSGIFQKTGLLDGAKQKIAALSEKTTPFTAILCTSCVSAMIACNQTLAIILTKQLCEGLQKEPPVLANDLEDSAVVVSPLVPWSIAGSVPLSVIGAPLSALLFACYLYLIPLWKLIVSFKKSPRRRPPAARPGV